MTREEVIRLATGLRTDFKCESDTMVDFCDFIIRKFELLSILDKIRAEIDEQYDRVHPDNISCAEGLEMALEIIDKYIESEDKE